MEATELASWQGSAQDTDQDGYVPVGRRLAWRQAAHFARQ